MSLAKQNAFGQLLADTPKRLVQKVTTIEEAKHLRDMAEVARHACRKFEDNRERQNKFAELSLRAARNCGERLSELRLSLLRVENLKRGTSVNVSSTELKLSDLGFDKHQSSRFQRIARIPERMFERYLEDTLRSGGEITIAGLLHYVDEPAASPKQAAKEKRRGPKEAAAPADRKFTTLFIDARGLDGSPGSRRATSKLLGQLSVGILATSPKSHLYLALRQNLFLELPSLLKQFRFSLVGSFAWNTLSPGGLLPVSAEVLLIAARGELPFQVEAKALQFAEPAREGCTKELLFETVRTISPGPYLCVSIENNEPAFEEAE